MTIALMQCEWCGEYATVRLKVRRPRIGPWTRFACRNTAHASRIRKLVDIDIGGNPKVEAYYCTNGFRAVTGRPVR